MFIIKHFLAARQPTVLINIVMSGLQRLRCCLRQTIYQTDQPTSLSWCLLMIRLRAAHIDFK